MKIYFPKRDGIRLKNLKDETLEFPYKKSMNSKMVCSCFVDDMNIGTPKTKDGNIDWKKIVPLIKKELKAIEAKWSGYSKTV